MHDEDCADIADDLIDIEQEEDKILTQMMADFICNLDDLMSE